MMKLRLADARASDRSAGHRRAERHRARAAARFVIGAMTTQAELIGPSALAAKVPILRETALQIADPQVRNCGTIGGNVANGDPGNDMPAVMQALDAELRRCAGRPASATVAARDFYQGAFATALADDEILTAIRIPLPPAGHGSAYVKQKRKIGDYATAAAAVVLTIAGGRCATPRDRADQPRRHAALAGGRGAGAGRHAPSTRPRSRRRSAPRRDHRAGRGPARPGGVPQARRRRHGAARDRRAARERARGRAWPRCTSS